MVTTYLGPVGEEKRDANIQTVHIERGAKTNTVEIGWANVEGCLIICDATIE